MSKFIIGLVLGIAIAAGLAFYLNNMPNQFVKRVGNTAPNLVTDASSPMVLAPGNKLQELKNASDANKNQASSANASGPSYDFYSVLQGKNASDIQKKAIIAQTRDNKTKKAAKHMYVEAGSFANADAASNMTAQLTLLGYTPKVRTLQNGSTTVNQILIGPFTDSDKAQDVIKDLAKEQINATLYQDAN